jgi:UDP-glucose 4-epimerase
MLGNLSTGFEWTITARVDDAGGRRRRRASARCAPCRARPSAIIHFAASVVVPEAVAGRYYCNNTVNSQTLIEAPSAATSCISSSPRPRPFMASPIGSLSRADAAASPYGSSKLMVERDAARAHGISTWPAPIRGCVPSNRRWSCLITVRSRKKPLMAANGAVPLT